MTARAILLLILMGLPAALTPPASAVERPSRMTPACAERDLKVVTLIEAGGESDAASPVLARAGLAQLQARLTCGSGQEREGLALYDEILRDLSRIAD
jgi:hypothetical protein